MHKANSFVNRNHVVVLSDGKRFLSSGRSARAVRNRWARHNRKVGGATMTDVRLPYNIQEERHLIETDQCEIGMEAGCQFGSCTSDPNYTC